MDNQNIANELNIVPNRELEEIIKYLDYLTLSVLNSYCEKELDKRRRRLTFKKIRR